MHETQEITQIKLLSLPLCWSITTKYCITLQQLTIIMIQLFKRSLLKSYKAPVVKRRQWKTVLQNKKKPWRATWILIFVSRSCWISLPAAFYFRLRGYLSKLVGSSLLRTPWHKRNSNAFSMKYFTPKWRTLQNRALMPAISLAMSLRQPCARKFRSETVEG